MIEVNQNYSIGISYQDHEDYQNIVDEKSVNVISLVMLYDHRDTIMFRVLGYDIYTIINKFICIDFLCLIQYKLSKHDNFFEKKGLMFVWDGDTWYFY